MSSFPSPESPQDDLPPVRPDVGGEPAMTPPPMPASGGGNGWLLPVAGCGAVVVVGLLLICGGVYSVISVVSESDFFAASPPLVAVKEISVNVQVLDGDWSDNANRKIRSQMGRFITELEETSAAGDQAEFMRLVDFDAHMERYYAAYRHELDYQTRRELDELERERFQMPDEATDFRIAAIEQPTEHDVLVYTYAQAGALSNTPYVFHLRKSEPGRLKLVDWQEVAEQLWAAEFNSLGTGPVDFDTGRETQEAIYDNLRIADDSIDAGDLVTAERSIRRAESRSGVEKLENRNRYLIAIRWHWLGRPEEALRVCNASKTPESYPWIDWLKAEIYAAKNEHEKVLECTQRYEANAGFEWQMKLHQTNALAGLGRDDEASAAAIKLVAHRVSEYESLNALFTHVPAEQVPAVLADLSATPELLAQLVSYAPSLLYSKNVKAYAAVRSYVAGQFEDSSKLTKLDADRLHYEGKIEAAIALFEKRFASISPEDEAFSVAMYDLVNLQLLLHEPTSVYQSSKHPRQLMELLYEDVYYDEGMLAADDFVEVARLHIGKDSGDPMRFQYELFIALQEQDWPRVKQTSLAALNDSDKAELDEYIADELRDALHQAVYELDEWPDFYLKANDHEDVYSDIARIMLSQDDYSALNRLNRLHLANAQGLWLKYYQLRVDEEDAKASGGDQAIANVLRRYQQLKRENEQAEELYPYTLQSQINALTVKLDNWRQMFADAEEPEALFNDYVSRFRKQNDEKGLLGFLARYRARFPGSVTLKSYELDKLADQGRHREVVAKTTPWPPAEDEDVYLPIYHWRRLRFQSQLMTGDYAGAKKTTELPEEDIQLQLAFFVAKGDIASLEELLADENSNIRLTLSPDEEWMQTPAVREFMRSSEFRELCNKYPPGLSAPGFSRRAMFFFDQSIEPDKTSIEATLNRLGGEGVSVARLDGAAVTSNTFHVVVGTDQYYLSWGERETNTDDAVDYSWPEELAGALDRNRFWIAIESSQSSPKMKQVKFDQFASAFAVGAHVLYMQDDGYRDSWGIVDEGLSGEIKGSNALRKALDHSDSYLAMPLGDSFDFDDDDYLRWNRRCQRFETEGPVAEVEVLIRQGSAVESHWLKVTGFEHLGWGRYSVTGRFKHDSQINPLVRSGDLVHVSEYEVNDWRD